MIDLLQLYGKRFTKLDHLGVGWDPDVVDMVLCNDRKWPMFGAVFDNDALMLDWRSFTSFRVRPGNFGFLNKFLLLKTKLNIDKKYLREYFSINEDNPFALYNVICELHGNKMPEVLTQFPPLRRTLRNENDCAVPPFSGQFPVRVMA